MPIPQLNPLMFERESARDEEAPVNIDERPPQLDKVISRCRCGCACAQSRGDNDNESDRASSESPFRGRSPTVREVISNHNPLESRPAPRASEAYVNAHHTSVQGQEGVAGYQLEEIGDLGTHTRRSVEQILARHGQGQCSYPAPFNSPSDSMIVETTSGEHSMASSGFLLPLTRSPSALLGHVGSFDTDDHGIASPQPQAQGLVISPLWLNYERQFCRNLELGVGQGIHMHYPITLDIDEDEYMEFDV